MLQNLYVKNMALIEEADISFQDGLNILSGETGAGKSILIGSINLALGGKAAKGLIRHGASYAYVELTFSINEPIQAVLEKLDLYPEGNLLTISRKLTENRSVSRINGESVSIHTVRAVAELLLDIHGQQEHVSLMRKSMHLEILDKFGGSKIEAAKEKVASLYKQYEKCKKQLERFQLEEEQRLRQMSFLEYELREIEEAALQEEEEEPLMERYKKLANGRQIAEGLEIIQAALGSDRAGSASNALGSSLQAIGGICQYDGGLQEIQSMLLDAEALVTDINREVSGYLDSMELDEEALYEIQIRLDLIHNLKKKYGGSVQAVLASAVEKQKEYDTLLHFEEQKAQWEQAYAKAERDLQEASVRLSRLRQSCSETLSEQITRSLSELNFLSVQFSIRFSQLGRFTAGGMDEAEFYISTNPGEEQKPLGKVASGGELSRIMLAIKTVLADTDEIETLIFDEIDAGISGRTAQMVSEKLSEIGCSRQVICISHLPQIVSMADAHFLIEKQVEDGATVTRIRPLEEEQSILELARLLGGSEITDTTIAGAKEMKQLAEQKKKR